MQGLRQNGRGRGGCEGGGGGGGKVRLDRPVHPPDSTCSAIGFQEAADRVADRGGGSPGGRGTTKCPA